MLKSKLMLIPSFCKQCGRDVKNFQVSDEIWELIEPKIKYGSVLCYECFCQKCEEVGLLPIWKLEKIE